MDAPTKIMSKKEESKMLNLELYLFYVAKKIICLVKKIADSIQKNARKQQQEQSYSEK